MKTKSKEEKMTVKQIEKKQRQIYRQAALRTLDTRQAILLYSYMKLATRRGFIIAVLSIIQICEIIFVFSYYVGVMK